jgi:flagellar protein FlaG
MQVKEIISTAGHAAEATKGHKTTPPKVDGVEMQGQTLDKSKLDEVKLSEANLDVNDFEKTMESLKDYVGWGNFNIDFATDDQTGSMVIKIIDRDTGETLRQIPPDQILSLRSHLQEFLGLVFDHMA